jgi:hypothetical protein
MDIGMGMDGGIDGGWIGMNSREVGGGERVRTVIFPYIMS